MVLRVSGLVAALIGFVVSVVQLSPGYVTQQLADGHWQWVPRLETMGQTLVLYNYIVDGVVFGFGVVGVFALGYWVGTELDLRTAYRRFALTIGVGGLLGYLLPIVAAVIFVLLGDGADVLGSIDTLSLLLFAGRTIGFAIQVAIIGFAGAAFARLTADSVRRATADA